MADRERLSEMEKQAFERGVEARKQGKPKESPYRGYPSKKLDKAFEEGWDSTIKTSIPEVRTPVLPPVIKRTVSGYDPRRPSSCPECKKSETPTSSQAVICRSIRDGVAYLWCRCCGHRFKLSTKKP